VLLLGGKAGNKRVRLLIAYCGGPIPIKREDFTVTFEDTFAQRFLRNRGAPLDAAVAEVVAKYWHSFPCVASMEIDRELGETILHMGGFMHYRAVQEALAEVGVAVELPTSPATFRVAVG
jgi:hypothetical protein